MIRVDLEPLPDEPPPYAEDLVDRETVLHEHEARAGPQRHDLEHGRQILLGRGPRVRVVGRDPVEEPRRGTIGAALCAVARLVVRVQRSPEPDRHHVPGEEAVLYPAGRPVRQEQLERPARVRGERQRLRPARARFARDAKDGDHGDAGGRNLVHATGIRNRNRVGLGGRVEREHGPPANDVVHRDRDVEDDAGAVRDLHPQPVLRLVGQEREFLVYPVHHVRQRRGEKRQLLGARLHCAEHVRPREVRARRRQVVLHALARERGG